MYGTIQMYIPRKRQATAVHKALETVVLSFMRTLMAPTCICMYVGTSESDAEPAHIGRYAV
jgi:hypothetical protein